MRAIWIDHDPSGGINNNIRAVASEFRSVRPSGPRVGRFAGAFIE